MLTILQQYSALHHLKILVLKPTQAASVYMSNTIDLFCLMRDLFPILMSVFSLQAIPVRLSQRKLEIPFLPTRPVHDMPIRTKCICLIF